MTSERGAKKRRQAAVPPFCLAPQFKRRPWCYTTASMKGQLKVKTPAEYIARLKDPRKSEIAALDALIRKTAWTQPRSPS